jgi:hypothetical protein
MEAFCRGDVFYVRRFLAPVEWYLDSTCHDGILILQSGQEAFSKNDLK